MSDDEIRGPEPGSPGWRPGTYQGRVPNKRSHELEDAAIERLEGKWFAARRYRRRARVTRMEQVTPTRTVRIGFEVVDDEPFAFDPGQFVGIEQGFEGLGFRRSPYCILSPPTANRSFDLLVREVEAGPLSKHLCALDVGDEISFRGPTGRSMVPHDETPKDLVLVATGVGIAPFYSLLAHLLAAGYGEPVRLYWGLRLVEDICLLDELEAMAADHSNFSFDVSLSQPPPGWTGTRGRVTESVPPRLATLADKRFYLAGNGAMIEELAGGLSDMGVGAKFIYKEAYFNAAYVPDAATRAAIRGRFVARDMITLNSQREASSAKMAAVLDEARTRAPGSPDALGVSDIFDMLPSLLAQDDESGE